MGLGDYRTIVCFGTSAGARVCGLAGRGWAGWSGGGTGGCEFVYFVGYHEELCAWVYEVGIGGRPWVLDVCYTVCKCDLGMWFNGRMGCASVVACTTYACCV